MNTGEKRKTKSTGRVLRLVLMCLAGLFPESVLAQNESVKLPSPVQEAMTRGLAAANQKAWDVAIKYFDEARKAMPWSPDILYDLALAHDKAGNKKVSALYWYSAFLAAEPQGRRAEQVKQRTLELEMAIEMTAKKLLDMALPLLPFSDQYYLNEDTAKLEIWKKNHSDDLWLRYDPDAYAWPPLESSCDMRTLLLINARSWLGAACAKWGDVAGAETAILSVPDAETVIMQRNKKNLEIWGLSVAKVAGNLIEHGQSTASVLFIKKISKMVQDLIRRERTVEAIRFVVAVQDDAIVRSHPDLFEAALRLDSAVIVKARNEIAPSMEPWNKPGCLAIARAWLKQGDKEAALNELRQIGSGVMDPWPELVMEDVALAYLDAGDMNRWRSKTYYDINQHRWYRDVFVAELKWRLQKGDPKSAFGLAISRVGVVRQPPGERGWPADAVWSDLAVALVQKSDLDDALECCRQVTHRYDDRYVRDVKTLVDASIKARKFDTAMAVFCLIPEEKRTQREADELAKSLPDAEYDRAIAFLKEASPDGDRVLALSSFFDHAESRANLPAMLLCAERLGGTGRQAGAYRRCAEMFGKTGDAAREVSYVMRVNALPPAAKATQSTASESKKKAQRHWWSPSPVEPKDQTGCVSGVVSCVALALDSANTLTGAERAREIARGAILQAGMGNATGAALSLSRAMDAVKSSPGDKGEVEALLAIAEAQAVLGDSSRALLTAKTAADSVNTAAGSGEARCVNWRSVARSYLRMGATNEACAAFMQVIKAGGSVKKDDGLRQVVATMQELADCSGNAEAQQILRDAVAMLKGTTQRQTGPQLGNIAERQFRLGHADDASRTLDIWFDRAVQEDAWSDFDAIAGLRETMGDRAGAATTRQAKVRLRHAKQRQECFRRLWDEPGIFDRPAVQHFSDYAALATSMSPGDGVIHLSRGANDLRAVLDLIRKTQAEWQAECTAHGRDADNP